jgi:hypothetical protein
MSNRCQGWVNPDNLNYSPHIDSLSSYQSPSGSNTLVSISGTNFWSYSSISFGTFYPTVYFINSNILQFYVPNTLSSGTFSVQVFNGSTGSNIVTYTIDNASAYWLLNSNNNISNTNSGGVVATWLSRGAPVILDNSYNSSLNPYVVPNNVNWIISDASTNVYIQLPTGIQYSGREIMFKSIGGTILATSSIVQPLTSSLYTDVIVNGIGQWSTLVTDGSTWYVMQGSPKYIFNNIGEIDSDITMNYSNMFKVNTITYDVAGELNIFLPSVTLLNDGDYISFNCISAEGGYTTFKIKDSTGSIVAQTGGSSNAGGTIRTVAYQEASNSWWLVD